MPPARMVMANANRPNPTRLKARILMELPPPSSASGLLRKATRKFNHFAPGRSPVFSLRQTISGMAASCDAQFRIRGAAGNLRVNQYATTTTPPTTKSVPKMLLLCSANQFGR